MVDRPTDRQTDRNLLAHSSNSFNDSHDPALFQKKEKKGFLFTIAEQFDWRNAEHVSFNHSSNSSASFEGWSIAPYRSHEAEFQYPKVLASNTDL